VARELTVVIACGGTGGHLFPGIAVAEELGRRGHKALLLISEKKVDADASAKYGGLEFVSIPAIAKPSSFSPRMVPFLFRLWKTVRRCRALLRERGADAVLGMGGFTSLAPVYAGHRLGLPTYVHDSNAVPGKANVLTSRFCTKVLLGLAAAKCYFGRRETLVTGTPVRRELHELPAREASLAKFGLRDDRPVVLVVGGSQGAKGLNTLILDAGHEIDGQVQWLHIAGKGDYERVKTEAAGRPHHVVLSFCDDMASAYAASTMVICRSGASSLTELALLGLPAILVPYPFAADDHQTKNAEAFVDGGAAKLFQESDLSGEKLAAEVAELALDSKMLAPMAEGMRRLSVDDAAGRICNEVVDGRVS
jgi:UDP-N-acetylglucosamine--N-acetylmuramyl-(pentapeptide) pyrophosphoryl-undecaprenol N-acetylglucosamine transferase